MLFDLLKKSANKYANYIAAEDKNTIITYKTLFNQSLSLGHMIVSKYHCNDKRVGILMEKNIDCLIAIFGVLSAQKAYVPMDEGMPIDRLRYIYYDAGLQYLITDIKHYNLACDICDSSKVILFDRKRIERYEPKINIKKGKKGSLAYILYTSGSTGSPKGIMHTHRSAIAFIKWAVNFFSVNQSDVLSSHAPFHFDLSIFDIFASISVGAKICILPKSISSFPTTLIKYIQDKKITIWYSVPYILINIFKNANRKPGLFKNLRIIIYAGEAMAVQNAKIIMELQPWTEIYNLYGPTETNVITYYKLDESTFSRKDKKIPIGSACPYAKIRVIDQEGREVKDGENGQLVVKSDTLMIGYIGGQHIEENSEYKTGDIVTKDKFNVFTFVGRKDQMKKVNGFRVELGDIESNVKNYPGVIDCYANVKQKNNRDVIEVHIETKTEIDIRSLNQFMANKVPPYMLPGNYKVNKELKRNTRGKIVRK